MVLNKSALVVAAALCASLWSIAVQAEANKVVIGDIDDMSGVYADIHGPGGHRSRQDGDRRFRRVRPGQTDRTADIRSPEQARSRRAKSFANGPTATG